MSLVSVRVLVLNEGMVRVTDAFLNTLLQPVVMLDILDFFTLVRDRSCVLLA